MKSHDFGFNYMMLARSPLYLFLLVNSRPWASSDVNCLADIFSLFVKYWLERDIEKGRSRWGFTTDDRLDFMTAVAWKMFQERRHALTFNELDACVRKFIGEGPKEEDYVSLGLDLQTTGIFNCVGNVLQFCSRILWTILSQKFSLISLSRTTTCRSGCPLLIKYLCGRVWPKLVKWVLDITLGHIVRTQEGTWRDWG